MLAHEVLAGKAIVLLVGALLIGWIWGAEGTESLSKFYGDLLKGLLSLFLLGMGILTASRFDDLCRAGLYLVGFGIVLPIVSAAGGVLTGWWLGLSLGVTFPFNVLAGAPLYHQMALLMYRGGGQAG